MVDTSKIKFNIPNVTIKDLSSHGFKCIYSNPEETFFSRHYPIYKYKNKCTIDCEIIVEVNTGDVSIKMLNANTKTLYPLFYNQHLLYAQPMINKINENLMDILNKIGAVGINE